MGNTTSHRFFRMTRRSKQTLTCFEFHLPLIQSRLFFQAYLRVNGYMGLNVTVYQNYHLNGIKYSIKNQTSITYEYTVQVLKTTFSSIGLDDYYKIQRHHAGLQHICWITPLSMHKKDSLQV